MVDLEGILVYAIRLAHTHHDRVAGVVALGGGCQYMLHPERLSHVIIWSTHCEQQIVKSSFFYGLLFDRSHVFDDTTGSGVGAARYGKGAVIPNESQSPGVRGSS